MKNKKITLADIARYAGVSKSTVSFVLNGHADKHRITAETVKKVLDVVEKYQYAPSVYARALKSNKTYTVGLVIPDLLNTGFATIAKELENLCRGGGYQLLIASSDDDVEKEKRAVISLVERQVDLMMVASAMTTADFYREINENTPVILFDREIESSGLPTVISDAKEATQSLVSSLISGKATSECYYLGGLMDLSPGRDRLRGYKQALEYSSLSFSEEWILHKDYQPESGYQMIAECHTKLGRLPETVFTASYSILEGVLRYLSEHKLLTNEITLGTFDNHGILDCLPIVISSVEQDCTIISKRLYELMKQLIEDKSAPAETILLPAKLHIRTNIEK